MNSDVLTIFRLDRGIYVHSIGQAFLKAINLNCPLFGFTEKVLRNFFVIKMLVL